MDATWEVEFSAAPGVRLGQPRKVFPEMVLGFSLPNGWPPGFDVSADGQTAVRLLAAEPDREESNIVVVQNWPAEFSDEE